MNNESQKNKLGVLGKIVSDVAGPVTFNVLEIGALPVVGTPEPSHQLLDAFPGSGIIAFEVDEKLCEELNQKARPGIKYYPVALGHKEEERTFYETVHPMCCSLFRPNEDLLEKYQNLDVSMLKSSGTIETVSLDHFIKKNEVDDVDFIKIDIQGAELDVFKGGVDTLKNVVAIVSEVIFIPLYIGQPLFGEVCQFLAGQGLMFHKLLGVCGRTLKPMIMNNDPNYPSQHMWSDAVYIKNILELPQLPSDKLLKMGILAFLYGSPDVAFSCFSQFDKNEQTDICKRFSVM